MNEKQSEEAYITLFCEIFTTVLKQIEHRFSGLRELQFLDLLNPHHFLIYEEKFPDENYLLLKKRYSDFFDLPDLKTELSVIYTLPVTLGKCFRIKSVNRYTTKDWRTAFLKFTNFPHFFLACYQAVRQSNVPFQDSNIKNLRGTPCHSSVFLD